MTSPFRHHSLRSPPTLPNRQSDNRHRHPLPVRATSPPADYSFLRQYGRQRNPQTPSTATQLALDQGPHCKDSQHIPRETPRRKLAYPTFPCDRSYTKDCFEKLCDLEASRRQAVHEMHMLTLTPHTATPSRHRLPYSNDHGLPTCAQVQRLLCRPTTPHNHDHQRRMIHCHETPQELDNISLTYTQGPRWYRRYSRTNPHSHSHEAGPPRLLGTARPRWTQG